jgi:hypothetical protein
MLPGPGGLPGLRPMADASLQGLWGGTRARTGPAEASCGLGDLDPMRRLEPLRGRLRVSAINQIPRPAELGCLGDRLGG